MISKETYDKIQRSTRKFFGKHPGRFQVVYCLLKKKFYPRSGARVLRLCAEMERPALDRNLKTYGERYTFRRFG